jgi:sugar phosphate isomerase/epimerase
MSIRTGVVSVTFRKLSPARVIALAQQARLDAIEWGGDVHVPVGDISGAREVGRMTRDAGLDPLSYGSYYIAGLPKTPFAHVLETAAALGAGNIRIWAGEKGSKESNEAQRGRVVDDIRAAATLAEISGITVSLERHGGTLTDTPSSGLQLFHELNHGNVRAYWQPAVDLSHEAALAELRTLMPWLSSVHVFRWVPGGAERLSLSEGLDDWREYLATIKASPRQHAALLEFVRGDSAEAFLKDAQELRRMLE